MGNRHLGVYRNPVVCFMRVETYGGPQRTQQFRTSRMRKRGPPRACHTSVYADKGERRSVNSWRSTTALISSSATCALKIRSRVVLCPYAPLSFSDTYSAIHLLTAGGNEGDRNILLMTEPETPEVL